MNSVDGDRSESSVGESDDRLMPDLSRLRSDTLLRELIDRASLALESEGRVHRLLDAVVGVASDLRLPDVLRRIVQSSCELVDAKYGALGVLGNERNLIDFITVGIDESTRARIGDPPGGKGILGTLIDHPTPLILHDLSDHPQSYGFPPNHPPMHTFLGVPIRVRGVEFGNLYLTEKAGGNDFTEQDQDVVTALAAAAGIAIENARLYEYSRQREAWLRASHELTEALLRGEEARSALTLVAERARSAAGAPLVCVALQRDGGDELSIEVVLGPAEGGRLIGLTLPERSVLVREVIASGQPQVLAEAGANSAVWLGLSEDEVPPEIADLAVVVVVPLAAGASITGALLVGRDDHQLVTEEEVRVIQSFAAHAALALEYTRAQDDRHRLAVFEDRDRIARDLHDVVIQRLFAVGLGLEGLVRQAKPDISRRLSGYVDDLDATIKDLRRSIFSLQDQVEARPSLRGELLATIAAASESLGFEPRLALSGAVDSIVDDALRADLLATVREALANVARHANATEASVEVQVDDDVVVVIVTDDGGGISRQPARASGLTNMAARARRWNGSFEAIPGEERGTRVAWRAIIEWPG